MIRTFSALLLLLVLLPATLFAQDDPLPSIEKKTENAEKMDGFFPLYWEASSGKVWLEIPRMDVPFLYVSSLPSGLGSNDIGLDRGQLGGERVVHFERVGPKVLLVEPNLRYRAETDNAAERRAVADAFAPAVVWGFTVAAETDGRVLVDATDFIVRDVHGIAQRLKQSGQGTFSLDASRSALHPTMTKVFPNNTEMEARLTFTGNEPGGYVRSVAADPTALTLRVRHSFVRLPDDGFEPRVMLPGSGYFGVSWSDYAVPIGEDLQQRYIARHRLQCADAAGADGLCTPVEPIVYYLDPGTPEPVRSALLDGARWWAAAFEAAGYRDAYRVEVLPDDADPMDVRYNVIQWVHRSTRGWSYGSSVTDPRTGEIIKGHVSLGSLRVRQDYLIAEGLLAPYEGVHAAGLAAANDPMLAMALARLRQLSAHEVGHTLGIAHNFAASPTGRASVMDYPAPLATVASDGSISLADAYGVGIGDWDKVVVRYGYMDLPDGANEQPALAQVLADAKAAGLAYLSDSEARPAGAANPTSNLWDNGADMVASLHNEMAVRKAALDRFGPAAIRTGQPLALLEEALVPLYLRHRYQVEATTKMLGGITYEYALRGDAFDRPQPVPADAQRAALDALLATITPDALRLPESARVLIAPRPPGYPSNRELFRGRTGLTFDAYAPAEVAAAMVLGGLIHPERAARLVYQNDADANLPGLINVLSKIDAQVWSAPQARDGYGAELQRLVQQVWTDVLMEHAMDDDAAPAVRARLTQNLHFRRTWLQDNAGRDAETAAHRTLVLDQISRYLSRMQDAGTTPKMLPAPPGSPIGQDEGFLHRQSQRQMMLNSWRAEACG